jgi:glucosamine--fructose-6-phosphate aminotransferase (isomerizing)
MSSTLHAEIHEQPEVIRRLLDTESAHAIEIGRALAKQDIRHVLIAARGTSDNAARYGQYLFGALNRLAVGLATPSLFTLYQRPPRLESALVIGISQSGQSPDIVSVIDEARRQGAATIAITNDPKSPLAVRTQQVIELHAGEERAVAATKTYSASLAALALLSISMTQTNDHAAALASIPDAMQLVLQAEEPARVAAQQLAAHQRCVVLGRGFNYSTTFEIALKLKELTYIIAEPYSSADFKHGPIAMIEPGFPVVAIAVGDRVRDELIALAVSVRERGASLIVLGDDESLRVADAAWLPVPSNVPEWLSPLIAIVPGQLLAYHTTVARGFDPDQPRAIQKVTLTR